MKTKKEPRHGWATGSGARTRKVGVDYSLHSAQGQELIDHRVYPPVSTGGGAWPKSLLTSAKKAVSLQASKQAWCVDLHLKSGLFLLYPTIEFAVSVGVSARPPEPCLALRTLTAFFIGGIHHE